MLEYTKRLSEWYKINKKIFTRILHLTNIVLKNSINNFFKLNNDTAQVQIIVNLINDFKKTKFVKELDPDQNFLSLSHEKVYDLMSENWIKKNQDFAKWFIEKVTIYRNAYGYIEWNLAISGNYNYNKYVTSIFNNELCFNEKIASNINNTSDNEEFLTKIVSNINNSDKLLESVCDADELIKSYDICFDLHIATNDQNKINQLREILANKMAVIYKFALLNVYSKESSFNSIIYNFKKDTSEIEYGSEIYDDYFVIENNNIQIAFSDKKRSSLALINSENFVQLYGFATSMCILKSNNITAPTIYVGDNQLIFQKSALSYFYPILGEFYIEEQQLNRKYFVIKPSTLNLIYVLNYDSFIALVEPKKITILTNLNNEELCAYEIISTIEKLDFSPKSYTTLKPKMYSTDIKEILHKKMTSVCKSLVDNKDYIFSMDLLKIDSIFECPNNTLAKVPIKMMKVNIFKNINYDMPFNYQVYGYNVDCESNASNSLLTMMPAETFCKTSLNEMIVYYPLITNNQKYLDKMHKIIVILSLKYASELSQLIKKNKSVTERKNGTGYSIIKNNDGSISTTNKLTIKMKKETTFYDIPSMIEIPNEHVKILSSDIITNIKQICDTIFNHAERVLKSNDPDIVRNNYAQFIEKFMFNSPDDIFDLTKSFVKHLYLKTDNNFTSKLCGIKSCQNIFEPVLDFIVKQVYFHILSAKGDIIGLKKLNNHVLFYIPCIYDNEKQTDNFLKVIRNVFDDIQTITNRVFNPHNRVSNKFTDAFNNMIVKFN